MNDSRLSLLPTLLAVGGGIAAAPASAIELGEVNIQSTIGQPLRASIAYALGPNEQLAPYCVTLNPGSANNGLPAITRADVSVANGIIALSGVGAIREPLMSLRVNISCPYTPAISREYMLFINPAVPQTDTAVQPRAATKPISSPRSTLRPAPGAAAAAAATSTQTRPAPRRDVAVKAPVDPSASYRVQRGDTLSEIAARIENRPIGLWAAVAQIFDANPDAFIDNNPDKLKAGSMLVIPEFGSGKRFSVSAPAAVAPSAAAPDAYDAAADSGSGANTVDAGLAVESGSAETAVVDDSVVESAAGETTAAELIETIAADGSVDDTEILEPAAQIEAAAIEPVDVENPFVDSQVPAVVIPDTELEAPTTARSPNVPTASISAPVPQPPAQASTNWLLWLGGGGVVLIAGLLLFGRRNRRFGSPAPMPAGIADQAPDLDDADADAVGDSADLDRHLHDDAPTEENLALDADLDVGTGLRDTGMHVYEDFGFATETNLDIELPEDEDYDMSVNVDATKLSAPDEATKRDLKAIQIDGTLNGDVTDAYTIDQEIDYQILEQDYQNELTATQALNVEIEKAAAEIAKSMDQTEIDELTSELQLATETEIGETTSRVQLVRETDIDETASQIQLASVTELDATALLSGDELEDSDVDPTEEITAANEELTLEELVAEDFTVEMPRDDDTVQMPRKTNTK